MSTIWECKIGTGASLELPDGADAPMRQAIEKVFFELTGMRPEFHFSGWGGTLSVTEQAALNWQMK